MNPHASRIQLLQRSLAPHKLHGFLLPRADPWGGEYVAPHDERLAWLCGFNGSAGLLAVLPGKNILFTDGRYTIQARQQIPPDLLVVQAPPVDPRIEIAKALPRNARLGYDPSLHNASWCDALRRSLKTKNASLIPISPNPLDALWTDQPPQPSNPLRPGPEAAQPTLAKRRGVIKTLKRLGAHAALISAPDSIAWLLNVRADDVPHTPVPLARCLLHSDARVDLFIPPNRMPKRLLNSIPNIRVLHPNLLLPSLLKLNKPLLVDPSSLNDLIFRSLINASIPIVRSHDPCILPKALKTPREIAVIRQRHAHDGAALTQFLHWLPNAAADKPITEHDAAVKLQQLRMLAGADDLSFPTISGSGPNAAVVHYRVQPKSARTLQPNDVFLVDSGAQYQDGATTDVTRSIALSPKALTPERKDRFTRVLKGHIALADAVFPHGTNGSQLDALARSSLWRAGLDYAHGTGHGVGAYLCVHEGPQSVSPRPSHPLLPGMILSNEPGYYKENAFGFRTENLMLVKRAPKPPNAEKPLLKFETLTLAPIDLSLVEINLLLPHEISWLNSYHRRVRKILSPLLPKPVADWLKIVAKPI